MDIRNVLFWMMPRFFKTIHIIHTTTYNIFP